MTNLPHCARHAAAFENIVDAFHGVRLVVGNLAFHREDALSRQPDRQIDFVGGSVCGGELDGPCELSLAEASGLIDEPNRNGSKSQFRQNRRSHFLLRGGEPHPLLSGELLLRDENRSAVNRFRSLGGIVEPVGSRAVGPRAERGIEAGRRGVGERTTRLFTTLPPVGTGKLELVLAQRRPGQESKGPGESTRQLQCLRYISEIVRCVQGRFDFGAGLLETFRPDGGFKLGVQRRSVSCFGLAPILQGSGDSVFVRVHRRRSLTRRPPTFAKPRCGALPSSCSGSQQRGQEAGNNRRGFHRLHPSASWPARVRAIARDAEARRFR